MTIEEIIAALNDSVAFLLSAAALLWALVTFLPRLKRMRHDLSASIESTDADVSQKYGNLLLAALNRIEELDKSWNERFAALEKENEELRQTLKERDKKLVEWAKGIEKLINYICELGHTPPWYPNGE